jgi:tRNA pseudouridine38-40 synthase
MAPQRNIRLLLEYAGTRYHGWQRQKNAVCVQQVLEEALTRLTGEGVRLIGSGRTDAGVHALGQVANFHTGGAIPLKVPPEFHARKSALSKTYEYRILNRPRRSPLHHQVGWWISGKLDLEAMAAAAALLPGEHDFSAFRASGSGSLNPVRRIAAARWRTHPGGWLIFTITGNGFLRGMVRSLVGTLVAVGQGKAAPDLLGDLLRNQERHLAGPTAPPQGLFLVEVVY